MNIMNMPPIKRNVEIAKSTIPSVDEILAKTVGNVGIAEIEQQDLLNDFNGWVKKVEAEALRIYKSYEDEAFLKLAQLYLDGNNSLGKDEVVDLVFATKSLEFIAGQMRKARGGSSFQKIVQKLLLTAGIPCELPQGPIKEKLKRIDLVCPSADTANKTPDKAVFLAVKRTLRERWKQAVPEQMKGARLYIVTLNGKCPEGKAIEIKEAGMVAFVPNELKKQGHLSEKPWIRPLSSLPSDIKDAIPKS